MTKSRNPLLVVDDEEANRDILSRRLRRAGYEVERASGGQEALRLLHEKEFEMVLLDNMMPEMSGIELLKLLRATYSLSDLPVIMVTAVTDGERVAEALTLGANDYVTKPIDFKIALARIQAQLARSKVDSTLRESEERFALAARGANDGLWDWDFQTGKMFYSQRWKEMLGYSDAEIGDEPNEWLSRVQEEDLQNIESQLQTLRNNGGANDFSSEHRVLHKDGSYRWMLSRGVAIRSSGGEANRMAGSQTDITNTKTIDAVTGLPNRLHLVESLRRILPACAAGSAPPFALLFVGLDRFKDISDSLGHSAGEQLLVEIGKRLIHTIGNGSARKGSAANHVARFGEEEFALVLGDVSTMQEATEVAARAQAAVGARVQLDTQEAYVTASIGVVTWKPEYTAPYEMLRDAGNALHRAKSLGRERTATFDISMRTEAVQRLALEREIQLAVERQEFLVYYQPKMILATGEVAGFEALVRWRHPIRGLVQPVDFISIAEETGMIVPIGEFVLRQACATTKRWHEQFPDRPGLEVSVNISLCQFRDLELVNKVRTVLKETGLNPLTLSLEITESVLVGDWPSTLAVLRQFQEMQVGIQLDDFGTGHSSLSHLSRLPCGSIKIDQSFVSKMLTDTTSLEIVKSVLHLAASLGMTVIAEGIETREQMVRLRDLGCPIGQGYYFGKPLPPDMAYSFMQNSPKCETGHGDILTP